ncbi:MAG: hypothetical protein KGL39_21530 [Patescibacteria group bacterium]|nr:hypothetical protein [Patescibacteria group bacterium]
MSTVLQDPKLMARQIGLFASSLEGKSREIFESRYRNSPQETREQTCARLGIAAEDYDHSLRQMMRMLRHQLSDVSPAPGSATN